MYSNLSPQVTAMKIRPSLSPSREIKLHRLVLVQQKDQLEILVS